MRSDGRIEMTRTDVAVKYPGRMRIGDEARICSEDFDRPVPVRISFVSPTAQFTPKFVEMASEREKLSYYVKLRIAPKEARKLDGRFKGGMTADVCRAHHRPGTHLGHHG